MMVQKNDPFSREIIKELAEELECAKITTLF